MAAPVTQKNRMGVIAAVITVLAYCFIALALFEEEPELLQVVLIYAAVTWVIALVVLRRELARLKGNQHAFRRRFPFLPYGREYGDFEHIFFHDRDLSGEIVGYLNDAFSRTFGGQGLEPVTLVDRDPNLRGRESREFQIASVTTTARGTDVTLALRTETWGQLQAVRWWLLLGGFVERAKMIRFVLLAPVLLPFWLGPYLLGRINIVDRMRTIYGSAYNDMDILTLVRGGHQTVFDALVEVLEKNGIDTSDLKMQRAQVMNIAISGGKVNMGAVIQGAKNTVAQATGAKAA
jgi:hypothetical protein